MSPGKGDGRKEVEFITELFAIVPDDGTAIAWLCTYEGDPKNGDWTGFAHDPKTPLPYINGQNAFYSIAAFRTGTKGRLAAQQVAVLALVLDDVGTKADLEQVRAILGEPSFIVETSRDNFQWGYLPVKPITADDIAPLHEAIKVLKAADPSGLNSIRYMRLPTGVNGKAGRNNFAVRLIEWHPKRRFTLEYFQQRLKVDPVAAAKRNPYKSPETVPDGERNDTCASHAGWLISQGITGEEGRKCLHDFNRSRANPKLEDRDVDTIWKSVTKTDARRKEQQAKAEAGIDDEFAGCDPRIVDELKALPASELVLPNDYVPYTVSARLMFQRLAKDRELFVRGGRVVELIRKQRDSQMVFAIDILTKEAFRSRLERSKRRVKSATVSHNGNQLVLKLKRCSADNADVLLATKEATECLPPLELVTRSPILIEHEGELQTLGHGYHDINGGILITASCNPAEVPLEVAVRDLLNLLHDFQFATPADKSRAVANVIGPCIRMGRLLFGHALVNATEADLSQAGKGYLLATERTVYGEINATVTKREGGVGSLDESVASALLSGAPFITLDNLRGKVASQYLESILTSLDDVPVRVPHRGEIYINARHVTFHLTSNGFEATDDLGNRSMITRLIKQPPDYKFRTYPEGSLIQHIQRNQAHYLGCVFAVVRSWYATGKRRLPTQHTFIEWVGSLDWIVQKVFNLPPLLEGHQEAVTRVTNPGLSWLRRIALVVTKQNRLGLELKAMALVEMSKSDEIEIPNAKRTDDLGLAQQVGILLARVFAQADECQVDVYQVRRIIRREYTAGGGQEEVKYYVFQKPGGPSGPEM